jgi:hypothetical protein
LSASLPERALWTTCFIYATTSFKFPAIYAAMSRGRNYRRT